jgi:hypothetical protein
MSPQATPTSPSTVDHDWERLADATEIVEDGLREVYVSALEVCKYDSAELIDVHTLADKVQQTLDPRSPKVKAIMRDMKQLEESLPIHPDSAIFLRQVVRVFSFHFSTLLCVLSLSLPPPPPHPA